MVERALIALAAPDGRVIHIKIEDGNARLSDRHGNVCGEAVDLGAERSRMYSDTTAWMILGQIARLPMAFVGDDSKRMDASILLTIGRCPFPLLRINQEGLGSPGARSGRPRPRALPGPGVHRSGDPGHGRSAFAPLGGRRPWMEAVLKSGSLPLVHRVMIALRTVAARNIPELSEWAHSLLQDRVLPACSSLSKRA